REAPEQRWQAGYVVAVLVRDKHAVHLLRRQPLPGEEGADPPRGNARVGQDIGPFRGKKRAVPRRAAGDYAYAHQPALALLTLPGSSGSESRAMSAPRLRSLPTKFSSPRSM